MPSFESEDTCQKDCRIAIDILSETMALCIARGYTGILEEREKFELADGGIPQYECVRP